MATADYGDGDVMRRALSGVDTLLLVSASEAANRVRLHATAVDAAVAVPATTSPTSPRRC